MKHMYKLSSILLVTFLLGSSGLRAQYCLPSYSTGCSFGDGLTLFQLGTINQSITCTAWYHDYTASSTSLTIGVPATITVQAGYSCTYVSFYIDYNHNNAFDAGELIGQVICASSATNYTLGFTVPGTALSGPTRLRALTEWISYPAGPCTSQSYGNCEDFTVNISGAYCTPSYSYGCAYGDGLTLFQLGTINQPVTCTGSPSYYHDWTASSTNLTANVPSTLTVQAGFSNTYVTVWVDLNNNFIFESSEIVVNNLICASSGVNYTAPIIIPTGTSLGNHRLRFRTSWLSSVSDPCASITYGNAGDFTVNVVAAQPPSATTAAATLITCITAQSNGTVNANGNSTTVSFDYGLTASYGSNVAGIPATVTGASATPVSAPLSGLLPNTLYHYRVKGTNIGGTTNGSDLTFTTSPTPVPTITGPLTGCTGIPGIVYTTEAGMNGYTWAISAGGTITAGLGTNSVTVTWNTAGAQFLSVNYTNLSGCSALNPTTFNVSVGQLPVPTITGSTSLCVNSGYYFYTTESGMNNYTWTISPGGTILAGLGTNSIMVAWNAAGAQSVSVNLQIPSVAGPPLPPSLG
jgi:hypothetical protein